MLTLQVKLFYINSDIARPIISFKIFWRIFYVKSIQQIGDND